MKSLDFERIGGYAFWIMLKRLTLTAVFAVIPFLMFTTRVSAQWTKIQQFPAADGFISASYFFNPEVGLIGFHWNNTATNFGMVKRTINGGQTWTNCTVPVLNEANGTAPIVSDIWFSDTLNGWLTFYGDKNTGDPLVWHSTDGGITWTGIVIAGMTGPTSVRQTPNAVTVTEGLGIGIWGSTDGGVTWTMSHSIQKSGLDFESATNGIATEYGENQTTTFLITTDGGLNWNNTPGGIQHNGWGVYAVKHGGIYVAAPEDTTLKGGAFKSSPVLRSTNTGVDWITQVPSLPMRTTGDVEGVNGVIYIQNSGSTGDSILNAVSDGLMRSTDSGQTWIGARGPRQGDGSPYPITTTRFSVTGCGDIVYASDGAGGLWKTTDGGDSTLIIPQCTFVDTDVLRGAVTVICDTEKGLYYLHNINTPGSIFIESISIFDTLGRPYTTGAVYIDSLPEPYTIIPKGDSVFAFGLAWHPGAMMDSAASDFVIIRVIFNVPYLAQYPDYVPHSPIDTIYVRISLEGITTPADFSVIPKSITKDTIALCNSIDTTIKLINKGCDSLTITQALLEKNNWTLTDTSGNALSVPFAIGPYDTLHMRLRATPVSATILADSLEVSMRYMGHDTSFGAGLRTSAKIKPWLVTADSLAFGTLATCDSTESPLTLTNIGCDSITITKDNLSDIHYELLDTNGVPLKLPLTIPADSIRNVLIRFIPTTLGTHNTTIQFSYQYVGYAFNSANSIALSGAGSATGTVSPFPGSINFGTVSICSSDTQTITFRNSSCGQIAFIDSVILPVPFVLIDSSVNLGTTIPKDSSITLRIRYQPNNKTTQSGTGTFFYALNGTNIKGDSSFTLTGTGGPGTSIFETNPPLSSNLFAFPMISQCDQPDSVSFTIYNTGCDTLVVTGIPLDAGLTGALAAFANMTLPAALGSGDSLRVTVDIAKLITGSYAGNIHIQYRLADGSTVDSLVPVSSTITAGSGKSTLTMSNPSTLNFNGIQSCSTPDTSIVLSYQGCGTTSVNLSMAGTGFTFANGLDSVISLSPGQTVTVKVLYDGISTGTLGSTVNIQSSGTLDTNYSVQLSGIVQPVDTVHFSLAFSKMPVNAGDLFNVTLTPDIPFSGNGLQEIYGVFQYRNDNFESGVISANGGSTDQNDKPYPPHGKIEYYPFHITGTNIQLQKGTALVTLPMEAMISDSVGGIIQVDSLQLNGGDVQFNNCVLSTGTPAGIEDSITLQCGDNILIGDLNGQPLVTSEQPNPNPVTEENGFQTTLNLVTAENGIAEITLYNALGEQITHDELTVASGGTVPYTFHLDNLPAGSYYYAVHFTSTSAMTGMLRGTFLLLK